MASFDWLIDSEDIVVIAKALLCYIADMKYRAEGDEEALKDFDTATLLFESAAREIEYFMRDGTIDPPGLGTVP